MPALMLAAYRSWASADGLILYSSEYVYPRTPWPPANGPYYYSITDDTNLRAIFENIVSIGITGAAYQDVKMTDTLSTYAEFAMPDEPNFGGRLVVRDAQGKEVPAASVNWLVRAHWLFASSLTPIEKTVESGILLMAAADWRAAFATV